MKDKDKNEKRVILHYGKNPNQNNIVDLSNFEVQVVDNKNNLEEWNESDKVIKGNVSIEDEKNKTKTVYQRNQSNTVSEKREIELNTDSLKRQRIIDLIKLEYTNIREIANIVGCSEGYVYQVLREINR